MQLQKHHYLPSFHAPFLDTYLGRVVHYCPYRDLGTTYRCKVVLFQPAGTKLVDLWPRHLSQLGLRKHYSMIPSIHNRWILRAEVYGKIGDPIAPKYFFVPHEKLKKIIERNR